MISTAKTEWCLLKSASESEIPELFCNTGASAFLLKILKFNSLRFWHLVQNEDIEGTVLGMRSKTLVWAYLIILSLGTILSLYMPRNEAVAKESIVIPGEAIRL